MDTNILDWIWRNATGHPYFATIDRRAQPAFSEHQLKDGEAYPTQPAYHDYFFSPLTFIGPRKNENARDLGFLYADLDHMDGNLLHKLWPHALWQTSPGKAQAVWKLNAPCATYDEWAGLNQRMTYFMLADKGGWAGSKLLRVPGTLNYKYDPAAQGHVLSFQPKAVPYETKWLLEALPLVKGGSVSATPFPDPPDSGEWTRLLAEHWDALSLGLRSDLTRAAVRDRSDWCIMVINRMLAQGWHRDDVFRLVWGAAWNKFRTDRYRPAYLWGLILKGE